MTAATEVVRESKPEETHFVRLTRRQRRNTSRAYRRTRLIHKMRDSERHHHKMESALHYQQAMMVREMQKAIDSGKRTDASGFIG